MVHSQRVNGVCQNRNPEDDAIGCDGDIYNIDCEASFSKLLPYAIIGHSIAHGFHEPPNFNFELNEIIFTFAELTTIKDDSHYDSVEVDLADANLKDGTVSCTINAVLPGHVR